MTGTTETQGDRGLGRFLPHVIVGLIVVGFGLFVYAVFIVPMGQARDGGEGPGVITSQADPADDRQARAAGEADAALAEELALLAEARRDMEAQIAAVEAQARGEAVEIAHLPAVYEDVIAGDMVKLMFPDPNDDQGPVTLPDREVRTGDGEMVSLGRYRGQVVVLNIWATNCAPCIIEMPHLNELEQTLGSERFVVAPVALEPDTEAPREFYETNGLDALPLLQDVTMGLGFELRARGMPTTIVFDAAGREVARLEGIADWASPEALAFLRVVMAESFRG